MAKNKIGWCDRTWNPASGCSPLSPGCVRCYAAKMSKRLAGRFGYPKDNPFHVTLHPDKLREPLKWKKPQRIFVCSMADWMHDDVPTRFIDQMLDVMSACPQHIFLTLTKRPENLDSKIYDITKDNGCRELGGGDWLPNLWFGVSVEDQKTADERIPLLLNFGPAAKRFISVEPMLGPIDIVRYFRTRCNSNRFCGLCDIGIGHEAISWVICGAESGPKARPMDLAWARLLRDQCKNADVPFFMKQISGKEPIPDDLMIREFPGEK